MKSMEKTIIITGGNSGLGYKCAQNIAKSHKAYHVVIACRNAERASDAVERLQAESGNPNVSHLLLNLASLESVRKFAKTFQQAELPPLYGIVCNAAGNGNDNELPRSRSPGY
jgi:NAD(P)-dependent dehydrogenase (short-subunit alcohol dehydrogenase family)